MALPKLNDVPQYELVIPSTGKTVAYRPFLVKEQKVLLMALESQDEKQVLRAVTDTIKSCIIDPVKIESLATFDVEYIFTQLRSKSAGEKTQVKLKCSECDEYTETEIDLNQIKIKLNEDNKLVELTDVYTLKMKYPQYSGLLLQTESADEDTLTNAIFEMIMMCLDELRTEDDIIKFEDEPREEVEKFLEGLTTGQLEKIMNFVNNLPKLEHKVDFNCVSCNHENTLTLQGLQDFF